MVSLIFGWFYSVSLSLHDDTGVGGDTGPELSSLLTDGTGDGGSLHLTLGVDDLQTELVWAQTGRSGLCRMQMTPVQMNNPMSVPHLYTRPGLVTHHTSVVLEVQVDTVRTAPGLALADDNGGHDLLAELGLSLLDGGHDHVTDTSGGETVQAGTDTTDGNDVQVTGTRIVAAVHHSATNQNTR